MFHWKQGDGSPVSFSYSLEGGFFLKDNKEIGLKEEMTLQEVAATLKVSQATVRNWIKAGIVSQVNPAKGTPNFSHKEILSLKKEIESGASHRLKGRRNKRAVHGNVVPLNYVNSTEYVQITEHILDLISQSGLMIDPMLQRLLLHEVALNLMYARGGIRRVQVDEESSEAQSLTELAAQGKVEQGVFTEIIADLWGLDQAISSRYGDLLRAVRALKIPWIQGDDLLGLVYMSLSNLGTRKSKGSYYTPTHLVDALVQKSMDTLNDITSPKILDPCCGSGNFLIRLFPVLVQNELAQGLRRIEAEQRVLGELIVGYDIDPTAVALAKINLGLLLETQSFPETKPFKTKIECRNTLESYEELFELGQLGCYDLMIGNPPWGYAFTESEIKSYKRHFATAKTSVESFALFVEYGIKALREGGLLAFVLPEALLNVQIHQGIRKLLLEGSKILEIGLIGHQFSKVFTPTVTFLAQKSSGTNCVSLPAVASPVHIVVGKETFDIPQKRFLENEGYLFNVNASNQEEEILKQLRTLPGVMFLAGNADFALGIVTGNNERFVSPEPRDGAEPVLLGKDIFKYNYEVRDNYLLFEPEVFQQVAPVHLYRAPEKLIYRFINENLIFAYDDSQILSLNSANLLIPHLSGYSMKYILAVLNSRAAQFFHSASFSSVKVLRKHIESIPIPPCDTSTQGRIVERVDMLRSTTGTTGHSQRTQLYEQIDEQIMSLYSLSIEQQDLIKRKFLVPKYLF